MSDLARAATYARQALSPATLAAYTADWATFDAWCRARGVTTLPAGPATVAAYLAALASTHVRATLRRRVAAIGRARRGAPAHGDVAAGNGGAGGTSPMA